MEASNNEADVRGRPYFQFCVSNNHLAVSLGMLLTELQGFGELEASKRDTGSKGEAKFLGHYDKQPISRLCFTQISQCLY